MIGP